MVCVMPEASVTEKELVEFCSVHLGNDKRPGKVVLRHDPLPKTPVGKIKSKALREPFRLGRERRVAGNRRVRAAASARMSQGGGSFHRRRRVL
jgi:acyl-CoA synthetase (AMP-forming)/AMP-acid ligase II